MKLKKITILMTEAVGLGLLFGWVTMLVVGAFGLSSALGFFAGYPFWACIGVNSFVTHRYRLLRRGES